MSARRGGIPGPESRTGLVRPTMSEAEFERRQAPAPAPDDPTDDEPAEPAAPRSSGGSRRSGAGSGRGKPAAKPRRVQRMFAVEEDLDKKLWLYAIHVGKDRSDVVNDLLRPIVASMVLYDSRDRRSSAAAGQGGAGGSGAAGARTSSPEPADPTATDDPADAA
jgi:hypothetical protein